MSSEQCSEKSEIQVWSKGEGGNVNLSNCNFSFWILAATAEIFLYCLNYCPNSMFLKGKYEKNTSPNK